MKAPPRSLLERARQLFSVAGETTPRAGEPVPVRFGWPPLSAKPLLRRRRTDAQPWFPGGPRDDWKR